MTGFQTQEWPVTQRLSWGYMATCDQTRGAKWEKPTNVPSVAENSLSNPRVNLELGVEMSVTCSQWLQSQCQVARQRPD